MTTILGKNGEINFVFILPVRLHENDENAYAKWRLLNLENNEDFENGARKNTRANSKNDLKQIHEFKIHKS